MPLGYITDEQRNLAGAFLVDQDSGDETFAVGTDLKGDDIRTLSSAVDIEEVIVGDCCADLGVCETNLAVSEGENTELSEEIEDLEAEIELLGPDSFGSWSYIITSVATDENPTYDEGHTTTSTFQGATHMYNGWDGTVKADATHSNTQGDDGRAILNGPGVRLYNRTNDTFVSMINSSPVTGSKTQIPDNQYAVTTRFEMRPSDEDWTRTGGGPAVHSSVATWAAGVVATPPEL